MCRARKRRNRAHRRKRKQKRSRSYSGTYKGRWCDSSWELAYIMYNLDHGIPIRRNTKGFSYTYYGKEHLFYPDFIVSGRYVEIKGKLDRKNKAKIRQFPEEIVLITRKEIQKYLAYAREKHGKNFWRLLKRGNNSRPRYERKKKDEEVVIES